MQAALLDKVNPKRPRPTGTLLALANPDFGGAERFTIGKTGTDGRPIPADATARRRVSGGIEVDQSRRPCRVNDFVPPRVKLSTRAKHADL